MAQSYILDKMNHETLSLDSQRMKLYHSAIFKSQYKRKANTGKIFDTPGRNGKHSTVLYCQYTHTGNKHIDSKMKICTTQRMFDG